MDGGQRTRRRDDQNFIHGFALGGVRSDGVAVGESALAGWQHPAVHQQNRIVLNGFDLDEFAVNEFLLAGIGLQ